jgi:hypothetical protein
MVPLEVIESGFSIIFRRLRAAVETLERGFGSDSADVLRDALESADGEVAAMIDRGRRQGMAAEVEVNHDFSVV